MQARWLFLLLVSLFCISFIEAEQDPLYFSMIEDISAGVNYYDTMGLPKDTTYDQIRKAWRKLALIHHPDKNPDPSNVAFFTVLKRAYEVLSNDAHRLEYDKLLIEGIPWQDKYYGRYAHKYTNDHDVRYILLGLVIIITIFKHLYQYYRYQQHQTAAKKNLVRKQQKAKGIKKKKKFGETEEEEELDVSGLPEIVIVGAEKPTWKDLFVVQLVCFPYWAGIWLYHNARWAYYCQLRGQYLEEYDEDEIARKASGCTVREWKRLKDRQQQKEEELRLSNRGKRERRYLRNRVIINWGDE